MLFPCCFSHQEISDLISRSSERRKYLRFKQAEGAFVLMLASGTLGVSELCLNPEDLSILAAITTLLIHSVG